MSRNAAINAALAGVDLPALKMTGQEDMMKMKKVITFDRLTFLIEAAKTSSELIISLFREVIAEFDTVKDVGHFPQCSEEFSAKVFEACRKIDYENKVNHMLGGVWFNSGFSTINKEIRDSTYGYHIEIDTEAIEYEPQEVKSAIGKEA